MATLITPSESHWAVRTIAPQGANDARIIVPDAEFLFTANFKRAGFDLILTGDDGKRLVLADYFRHDKPADLLSPTGAVLSAELVKMLAGPLAPGQYAQDAAPTPPPVIGRCDKVVGPATVQHANGTVVALNPGDLIYKGDIVQTARSGTLALSFADGTALNLAANTRMVMNEFAYDPNSTSNSGLLSLVNGSFAFVAGQLAKSGGLTVDTPVATMGIRGTVGGVQQVFSLTANAGESKYQFYAYQEVDASGKPINIPSTYELSVKNGDVTTVTYGSLVSVGVNSPNTPPVVSMLAQAAQGDPRGWTEKIGLVAMLFRTPG